MIGSMQQSGPIQLGDWITLTARWLFIIGLGVWLAFTEPLNLPIVALILTAAIANLAVAVLLFSNHMPPSLRLGVVVLDFILAHLALTLGGGGAGLAWAALLPVVSGALAYRWIGMLLVALLNGLLQAAVLYLRTPGQPLLLPAGLVVLSLLVGLPLAYLSLRLSSSVGRKAARPAPMDTKERERRTTIADMLAALSASLNYQRVLETAISLSAETLDNLGVTQVEQLVSAVFLFSENSRKQPELQIASSRNLMPGEREISLPGASGFLAHIIDEGRPEVTRNLDSDAELSRIGSFASCKAAYGFPLRTGLDSYGLLLFAHPDADFFAADRTEVLDIVGKQSVMAIQNARLYQDLEQEKNRLMEAQEESRKKLARDLHDGPTQSVSAIAMRVNFARRLMDRDVKAAAEELFKIEDLARRTTKEIRHMLFTLRPLVLESQGLAAALESMAEKMKETFEQNVLIQVDGRMVEALETSKQAVVFYIAEEAVNNARKHAKAEHIWVRLKLLRDGLSLLEVEDDGVGFDVNEVGVAYESRGSLGMVNLRERTELVNGVLRIDSAKGRGTKVQVVIPLTEEAADRIRRAV